MRTEMGLITAKSTCEQLVTLSNHGTTKSRHGIKLESLASTTTRDRRSLQPTLKYVVSKYFLDGFKTLLRKRRRLEKQQKSNISENMRGRRFW